MQISRLLDSDASIVSDHDIRRAVEPLSQGAFTAWQIVRPGKHQGIAHGPVDGTRIARECDSSGGTCEISAAAWSKDAALASFNIPKSYRFRVRGDNATVIRGQQKRLDELVVSVESTE